MGSYCAIALLGSKKLGSKKPEQKCVEAKEVVHQQTFLEL
jgi:hypothetical protein